MNKGLIAFAFGGLAIGMTEFNMMGLLMGVAQNIGKLNEGKNDLWNEGVHNGSEKVTDGTYFYKVRFVLDDDVVKCQNNEPITIGCEVEKEGCLIPRPRDAISR